MASTDLIYAADITNIQAGGTSFFENLGMAATAGVAGAVVSGAHALLNTGIDVSNKVFGTSTERFNTAETMTNIDEGWGAYYSQHKDVIDTAGFVAGSLIPGTLAVKGLKAVQAGQGFGAVGKALRATSLNETKYLESALKEIAQEGGSVFSRISANKLLSMSWGAADNVLQAAAFETATVLTMKASPMLDKEDWSHILWDVTKTSLAGGVVGGGIGALLTNRTLKDAGTLVDKRIRQFDIVKGDYTKTDLAFGDKAFGIVDAINSLPKEVADSLKTVSVKAQGKDFKLDIGALLDRKLSQTVDHGLLRLEDELTHVVKNDLSVGKALSGSLLNIWKQGIQEGVSHGELTTVLGGYLHNLIEVTGIGNKGTDFEADLLWINSRMSRKELIDTAGTKTPGSTPYRAMGDINAAREAVLGRDAMTEAEAFKAGFDLVLDPAKKTTSVNPASEIFRRLSDEEASQTSMFLNTRTNQLSHTTIPTIADISKTGAPIVTPVSVTAGDRAFAFRTNSLKTAEDSVEATARHLWASQLKFIGGEVSSNDIAIIDALRNGTATANPNLVFTQLNQLPIKFSEIKNLDEFAFSAKWDEAIKLMEGAKDLNAIDLRDIAYKLNVEPAWLEKAVQTRYDKKSLFDDMGWKRNGADYAVRENLIMRYDTAGMHGAETMFPDAITAFYERVHQAVSRSKAIANAVIGQEHASKFLDLKDSLTRDANAIGSGASFFGSSNANYNQRLKVWEQDTGAATKSVITAFTDKALSSIQTQAARMLRNPDAAAEVSALTTKLRLSTERYALYEDPIAGISLVDLASYKNIVERGGEIAFKEQIQLSKDAGEFMKAYHGVHQDWMQKHQSLVRANGGDARWDGDALYVPPIDTRRVPYFAFVRQKEGRMMGSSEVAMITAKDAGQLQTLVAEVQKDNSLEVIFKDGTERYFKAKGDYEFSRAMNQPEINPALRKAGKLGDYFPNMSAEGVTEDYIQHISRKQTQLARDAVTLRYGQTFTELEDLSIRGKELATSKMEGLSALLTRNVADPYGDSIKNALGISKGSEFTLFHKANEFVDAVGTRAYRGIASAQLAAREGKMTWSEANATLEKFGLSPAFTDQHAFDVAQSVGDRNLIKTAMQKANMLLANGVLRLDFANSLLNTISTPILLGAEVSSIRNSLKGDPLLLTAFNEMFNVAVPGTQNALKVPSALKMQFKAIANMFGEEGKALRARYQELGTMKGQSAIFHDMIDDLSLTPNIVPSEWATKVDGWVEKGASITFSNQAEDFTRFVSSDVMRQITQPLLDAGKMSISEQNAFIRIFTNRVQGNYIASQRPILFQGTLGSAVGLFQTYQFNLFQQLFRHIENRDLKTIAVGTALQTSIFGLGGLPYFDAINTHLIGNASINEGHQDIYSYATKLAGKENGDWLMYGTASAMPLFGEKSPALFSRGDLNPRNAFMVPTSLDAVPAIGASIKVVQNIARMAESIQNGGGLVDTMLMGLEHNGINRPLTGLAQMVSGRSTTSKGDLISASSDMDSIATAARLMGAKPMDEAVALNTLYRSGAWKAVDKERIESLGIVVKEKLRNNQKLTDEDWIDLQSRYAAVGGKLGNFQAAVQRWGKHANVSVVNELAKHRNTVAGQRMTEVLGGDPLADFTNQAALANQVQEP